jgi:hypothetical protein
LFRKACNTAFLHSGGDDALAVNVPVASLNDCINLCVGYNQQNASGIASGNDIVCNSVCWRNTFDTDFPGQCFGFQTQNSSNQFTYAPGNNSVCDSAAWINQSLG